MLRYQLRLIDLFIVVFACAFFVNANLKPRVESRKIPFVNFLLIIREVERGWPFSYQHEIPQPEFTSMMNEPAADIRTAAFFDRGPAVTSTLGLVFNILSLLLFCFAVVWGGNRVRRARTNKSSGQSMGRLL